MWEKNKSENIFENVSFTGTVLNEFLGENDA